MASGVLQGTIRIRTSVYKVRYCSPLLNKTYICRDGSARITYELITDCSQNNMAASSSPSVVTVNRIGQVSTTSLSGTAVVLVTVHEEFGINQTVVVHVEVRSAKNSEKTELFVL